MKRLPTEERYNDGSYLLTHPTWDAEHSWLKAKNIQKILENNNIKIKTMCEVGCGAGEILLTLQRNNIGKEFAGYEISTVAHAICKSK